MTLAIITRILVFVLPFINSSLTNAVQLIEHPTCMIRVLDGDYHFSKRTRGFQDLGVSIPINDNMTSLVEQVLQQKGYRTMRFTAAQIDEACFTDEKSPPNEGEPLVKKPRELVEFLTQGELMADFYTGFKTSGDILKSFQFYFKLSQATTVNGKLEKVGLYSSNGKDEVTIIEKKRPNKCRCVFSCGRKKKPKDPQRSVDVEKLIKDALINVPNCKVSK